MSRRRDVWASPETLVRNKSVVSAVCATFFYFQIYFFLTFCPCCASFDCLIHCGQRAPLLRPSCRSSGPPRPPAGCSSATSSWRRVDLTGAAARCRHSVAERRAVRTCERLPLFKLFELLLPRSQCSIAAPFLHVPDSVAVEDSFKLAAFYFGSHFNRLPVVDPRVKW